MIIDAQELRRRYEQRLAGIRDKKVYIGPEIVGLKIISACNLNCQYCPTSHAPGNPSHLDKPRFIEWEKFVEIIEDCIDLKVDQVDIGGTGEPTRHPLFREMIAYLEQKPLWARLTTNATFPLEQCSDVIKGDEVVITLSAVDRKQYEKIHGKDLFDRVIGNIERLASLRDSGKPGFVIELNYIVNALNVDQKQEMKDMASRMGVDRVHFIEMNLRDYNREVVLPEGHKERQGEKTPSACLNGWFDAIVWEDGRITSCVQIPRMPGCDIQKRSLKELWFSKRMMNMRNLGKHGFIPRVSRVCQTCNDYHRNVQWLHDLKECPEES